MTDNLHTVEVRLTREQIEQLARVQNSDPLFHACRQWLKDNPHPESAEQMLAFVRNNLKQILYRVVETPRAFRYNNGVMEWAELHKVDINSSMIRAIGAWHRVFKDEEEPPKVDTAHDVLDRGVPIHSELRQSINDLHALSDIFRKIFKPDVGGAAIRGGSGNVYLLTQGADIPLTEQESQALAHIFVPDEVPTNELPEDGALELLEAILTDHNAGGPCGCPDCARIKKFLESVQ